MNDNFLRYRHNVALSPRLNEWIIERAAKIKWHPSSDAPSNLEDLKAVADDIPILDQFNEDNIFGDPDVNMMFRAWHDSVHIKHDLPMDLLGETRAAFIQAAELPSDWWFERFLLMTEITGQVCYYEVHNNFVNTQRAFTINVLRTGEI